MLKKIKKIFYSPSIFFEDYRERPSALVPYVLVLFFASALIVFYFYWTDYEWIFETLISSQAGDMTPEEMNEFKGFSSKNFLITMSLIAVNVSQTILFLLLTMYTKIITTNSNLADDKRTRFGFWFGAICWIFVPAILFDIVSIVYIYSSEPLALTNIDIGVISNFLSFESNNSLLNTLSFDLLWTAILYFILLKNIPKFETVKALIHTLISFTIIIVITAILS